MLSIGDFARLAGVSVRMLRHYDALGLLRPARVDPDSGYRTYTTAQLDRSNRLVALKDLARLLARGLRAPARWRRACGAAARQDAAAPGRARRPDRFGPVAAGAGRAPSTDDREEARHDTVRH